MARKAIAATAASVLLFTALLVADSTVMAAQENLALTTQSSHTEVRESVLAGSPEGSVSFAVLAKV